MMVRFGSLIISLLLLSACTLDLRVAGKSVLSSSDSTFPLGEKKVLFGSLNSLAVQSNGNVVVVESSGVGAIILMKPTFETIKIIASYGSGPGQVDQPRFVAVDTHDNIYVTDDNNHRVQKFDPNGDFVLSWGTSGSVLGDPYKFDQFRGIATDSNDNVYVLATSGGLYIEARKYDSTGSYDRSFGHVDDGSCSGCAGYINNARGIAVDAADNVYIGDMGNLVVHKIDSTGVSAVKLGSSGTGPGQINSGSWLNLAISADGYLYVSEKAASYRVQKWSLNGIFQQEIGSAGAGIDQFANPDAVAFSPSGQIYVADNPAGSVGKVLSFKADGTYQTTAQPGGSGDGQLSGVFAVATYKEEFLIAADLGNKRIVMWDYAGHFVRNIGVGHLSMARSLGVDGAGNIYILDIDTSTYLPRVVKYTKDGTFVKDWDGSAGGGGKIMNSNTLIVSDAGDVYVSDSSQAKIQKFDSDGNWVRDLGFGTVAGPMAIALGPNNNMYVADYDGSGPVVFEISTLDGHKIGEFARGLLTYPGGITVGANGNIYVGDMMANKILQFAPNYSAVNSWGGYGFSLGLFSSVVGLAADKNGYIYAADAVNSRVQKFTNMGIPY